jgi:NitT/TauT family transport system ATP-binding protein
MNPLICFDGVSVIYPTDDGGEKVVLNDITLRVREGEFVTVVGPSGCGKSTALRMILGSQAPTVGIVSIDGEKVTRVDRDRGIVFQKYSLFPHITVLENIALGGILEDTTIFQRVLHLPGYFQARRVHETQALQLLQSIGLEPADALKYPHELSGGMQQRVAIAQALLMKPKVLLMDEPFGALDDRTRSTMQRFIIEQWRAHKMTVFFVTHDLEEALLLGTRVMALSQYWSEGDGDPALGAKIVCDRKIAPAHPRADDFRYTPQFNDLLQSIRNDALNPRNCKPISEFDYDHEDACHEENGLPVHP